MHSAGVSLFEYDIKPVEDRRRRRSPGLPAQSTLQLTAIAMSAPNPTTSEVVRWYSIGYGSPSPTERQLVRSVQECDKAPGAAAGLQAADGLTARKDRTPSRSSRPALTTSLPPSPSSTSLVAHGSGPQQRRPRRRDQSSAELEVFTQHLQRRLGRPLWTTGHEHCLDLGRRVGARNLTIRSSRTGIWMAFPICSP